MTVFIVANKLPYGIAIDQNRDEVISEQLCKPLIETLNDSKIGRFETLSQEDSNISFIKCYKSIKYSKFEHFFENVQFVGILDNYDKNIGELLTGLYKSNMKNFLRRKNCIPVFLDESDFNHKPGLYTDYIMKLSQCKGWDALFSIQNRKEIYQDYKNLNVQFYQVLRENMSKGDKIIIMDPDLWLLPGLLKEDPVACSVVFQIQFPPYEFFRCLYRNHDILLSLLESQLVFQIEKEEDVVRQIYEIFFQNFDQKKLITSIVPLVTHISLEQDLSENKDENNEK